MTGEPDQDAVVVEGRIHQNLFLPTDVGEMHAVVTLTISCPRPRPAEAVEVLALDASGSMDRDGKRENLVRAATAAIAQIPDGVRFAVVAGSHEASVLWPASPEPVAADAATRAEATYALRTLPARGGTAIGRWLWLCRDLVAGRPDALRHVTLLTDGRNEHETPAQLDAAVRGCVGMLRCDCRGIGVDFDPAELYNVVEKLDGTLHAVVDPARLAADFTAVMETSMSKRVELELALWTPAAATVRVLRQATPSIADLVPIGSDTARGIDRYLLGGFGDETREYHLCVDITPPAPAPGPPVRAHGPGGVTTVAEKLVARMSVGLREARAGDAVLTATFRGTAPDGTESVTERGQIYALWTHDAAASLSLDPKVAAARGRLDLAERLRAGLLAWRAGRIAEAHEILADVRGRAVEVGDDELAARLDGLYDEASGTFHLELRDEVELFEESTVTTVLDP